MAKARTTLDRRTVLKAASATAVTAALPRKLRAQNRSEVLVIGAGLSGLNAALLLEEAGVDVRLIEGRERVGGRVLSHRNVPGNPESGGTGFGPSVQVTIGGLPATTTTDGTFLYAKANASLAVPQSYPVIVVNPEGCRSQERVTLTVVPASCGLLGIEAVLVLLLARAFRQRVARR